MCLCFIRFKGSVTDEAQYKYDRIILKERIRWTKRFLLSLKWLTRLRIHRNWNPSLQISQNHAPWQSKRTYPLFQKYHFYSIITDKILNLLVLLISTVNYELWSKRMLGGSKFPQLMIDQRYQCRIGDDEICIWNIWIYNNEDKFNYYVYKG
jgi:hypothetical protein